MISRQVALGTISLYPEMYGGYLEINADVKETPLAILYLVMS